MTKTWSRHDVVSILEGDEDFLALLEREVLVQPTAPGDAYSDTDVHRVRICRTLYRELGVNIAGLEVALNLLERIEIERQQFSELLHLVRDELRKRGEL